MSQSSGRIRGAFVVFAFALLVRVLFLYSTADHAWPHSVLYEGDAPTWVRWAQALDRGEAFEFDLPMRTPAVAFALRLWPGVLAEHFTLLKLVWCAISAATCAALFVVVHRELSARVAWIAALLLAFAFGSYELATSLNNEAPYAFVLVLLVGATARFVQEPRVALAVALGILHGIALLLRAEHALILATFLVYALFVLGPRRAWRELALVAASALLVCAPWSLRSHAATVRFNTVESQTIDFEHARPPWNPEARAALEALPAFARQGNFAFLQALHASQTEVPVSRADVDGYFREQFGYVPEPLSEWTLVCSKGALDFALANHPRCDGGFSLAALDDGLGTDPKWAFGRPSHLKLYNHGYAVGWKWIRADPSAWAKLVGRKLERFLAGATQGFSAYDLPYGRALHRSPVDLATPLASRLAWDVAVVLAIGAGLALGRRSTLIALCALVILCKLAITVAFYGYARQAVSIEFALYVPIALLADASLTRLRCPPRLALALGVAAVLSLAACDITSFRGPQRYDIRPTSPTAKFQQDPQWGTGAFETIDEIEILPRRIR